jgi:hypothetical protein
MRYSRSYIVSNNIFGRFSASVAISKFTARVDLEVSLPARGSEDAKDEVQIERTILFGTIRLCSPRGRLFNPENAPIYRGIVKVMPGIGCLSIMTSLKSHSLSHRRQEVDRSPTHRSSVSSFSTRSSFSAVLHTELFRTLA